MRGFIFISLLTLSGGALALAATPTETLKTKNGELDKLLRQKPSGTADEKQQKESIKALAATLIDYGELTRRAMAEHWDKINQAQRDDLVKTLRELIERNYVKQAKSNLDYVVEYKGEKLAGEEATVATIVKVKTKGKTTDADVVYKLRKVDANWMVWDVVTDEVSLMRNYKTQFNRIITEQGFDALLQKMKDKLKEQT